MSRCEWNCEITLLLIRGSRADIPLPCTLRVLGRPLSLAQIATTR